MNLVIRNYPRTKMMLTKVIQEDLTKGTQASSLCGEVSRNLIFRNFNSGFSNTLIKTAAKVLCNLPDKFVVLRRSVKAWREK